MAGWPTTNAPDSVASTPCCWWEPAWWRSWWPSPCCDFIAGLIWFVVKAALVVAVLGGIALVAAPPAVLTPPLSPVGRPWSVTTVSRPASLAR